MRTIGEIKAALAAHPEWPDDMALVIEGEDGDAHTVSHWGVGMLNNDDMLHEQALILTPDTTAFFPIAPAP